MDYRTAYSPPFQPDSPTGRGYLSQTHRLIQSVIKFRVFNYWMYVSYQFDYIQCYGFGFTTHWHSTSNTKVRHKSSWNYWFSYLHFYFTHLFVSHYTRVFLNVFFFVFATCHWFMWQKMTDGTSHELHPCTTQTQLIEPNYLLRLLCLVWIIYCGYMCGWQWNEKKKSTPLPVFCCSTNFLYRSVVSLLLCYVVFEASFEVKCNQQTTRHKQHNKNKSWI